MEGGDAFCFAHASPAARLSRHKAALRATQGARELRNQLFEIVALQSNNSAALAGWLQGAREKYGAKALMRSAKVHGGVALDTRLRLQEVANDVLRIAPRMKHALREDFCAKLGALDAKTRVEAHAKMSATLGASSSQRALHALCFNDITAGDLSADAELAALVDTGVAVGPLMASMGRTRQSYLSMSSLWEHMKEWSEFNDELANACEDEYQLLMCVGTLGYPIDVCRRAATQMDPFAMDITRVRSSLVDTASLATALKIGQDIVPPEGGIPVQDLLVLIDPDAPRASRLAANSVLLREAYTSAVLSRDLHMYTGNKMRVAVHAHALLAAVQVPLVAKSLGDWKADFQRANRHAFQCAQCSFGPIAHFACHDLAAHHGERVNGAVVNNACPQCGWFSESLADWPEWDGTVPDALAPCAKPARAEGLTAASVEIALRISYSARAIGGMMKLMCCGRNLPTGKHSLQPMELIIQSSCCLRLQWRMIYPTTR